MTTTGAARLRKLIHLVGPRVIVVEEAAEVLEAHVLAALPPSAEQLILIGDHQQLRPTVETFELRTRHKLDISLFERLINCGVRHVTLHTQHRMRPEIASVLRPTFYAVLHDHPSVHR
jgi:superfamily I DNA and/or RNA helicase